MTIRSKTRFFQLAYRVGLTPWEGHPLSPNLRDLTEGPAALPADSAIDIGCGTGDSSIYLARHGWQVTGVDIVAKALKQARAKAAADRVQVNFVRADVTRLSSAAGIARGFRLILDSGCLHGMSDDARDQYVGQLTTIAGPHARLLILAFIPGGGFGLRGISQDEVQQRFSSRWRLLSAGDEPALTNHAQYPARYYLFRHQD